MELHEILREKMLMLVREYAPATDQARLMTQLKGVVGRVEFEALIGDTVIAAVSLFPDLIEFACKFGISGQLYPVFELDAYSARKTETGELYGIPKVLSTLRVCYRQASQVRLVVTDAGEPLVPGDDSDADGERFVVMPGMEDSFADELHEMQEMHQT